MIRPVPTDICLTIDVAAPSWAEVAQAALAAAALTATVFVAPTAAAAGRRLLAAGHDVQLLLPAPPDLATARDWLRAGIDAFARRGLPRPVAARVAGFAAGPTFYDAMGDFGLPLASCVGLGRFTPADPALRHAGGRHRCGRVVELPVLSYRAAGGRLRCLDVAAADPPEVRAVLLRARAAEATPVMALADARRLADEPGRGRLAALAAFVARHPDAFAVVALRARAAWWLSTSPAPSPDLVLSPRWERQGADARLSADSAADEAMRCERY